MSRWDVAVADEVPARAEEQARRSGSAAAPTGPTASCSTPTAGMRLANDGARAQRLLWASTGTKDPDASDTLYIESFASPFTVNTMPDKTLEAFADHGEVGDLMDPERRRLRAGAERVRRGRDRPRRRSPSGSRTRAKTASTRPGTNCSGRSSEKRGAGGQLSAEAAGPLREAPAWGRLQPHFAEIRKRAPARALRRRRRARRAPGRRRRRPLPRLLEEPDHRRDADAARRAGPRARASPSAAKRCSAASRSTSPRTAPSSTWRCACRASAR